MSTQRQQQTRMKFNNLSYMYVQQYFDMFGGVFLHKDSPSYPTAAVSALCLVNAVAHQEQWPKLKKAMCDVDDTVGHAHSENQIQHINYNQRRDESGSKGVVVCLEAFSLLSADPPEV